MPSLEELFNQSVNQPTATDERQRDASLEELYNQTTGQAQSVEAVLPTQSSEQQGELGLSFLEKASLRGKLAFGDDPEQVRSFLEERYPDREIKQIEGRRFSIDGIPIDPGGFKISDLPFDIIDISDEIVRLGAQIIGGAKGAAIGAGAGAAGAGVGAVPGAVIGTIVGGATGRGAGQLTVEGIGRFFGVQGGEGIAEVAKDVLQEAAIGGVSEGIGLGLRALSKPTVKFIRNFLTRTARRSGRSVEQTVLNFTGGMDTRNIKHLQIHGAEKLLTSENLSDDALLNVGKKIQSAAIEARSKLGKAVETGKGVIRNIHKSSIDITDIRNNYGAELQRVGLLDKAFKPIAPQIGKLDAGQKQMVSIFNLLKRNKNISPAKALQWRTELDRIIKFNQAGKITITDAENVVAQGLRRGLKNKLVEVSDDFAKANQDFAAFAQMEEMLKGKLDLQRTEGFLKNIFTGPQVFEDNLIKLNRLVGADKTFLPQLRNVVAARDFASTTFRGIRTGILSGLLGSFGFVSGGPLGAIPAAAAGAVLSTPRLAGKSIASRQALVSLFGRTVEKGFEKGAQLTPRMLAILISKAARDKSVSKPKR